MTLESVIPAMDLVVDFLSVVGPDDGIVVTELWLVAAGVLQTHHFDFPTQQYSSFAERGDTVPSASS
jgi:hypothetical protein